MGWATVYIKNLADGGTVKFRPRGNSMSGRIESGQLVTLEPIREPPCEVREIVLCKVNGTEYLLILKAVSGERVQIGNNRGRINGWKSRRKVFGILTRVEK